MPPRRHDVILRRRRCQLRRAMILMPCQPLDAILADSHATIFAATITPPPAAAMPLYAAAPAPYFFAYAGEAGYGYAAAMRRRSAYSAMLRRHAAHDASYAQSAKMPLYALAPLLRTPMAMPPCRARVDALRHARLLRRAMHHARCCDAL